MKSLRGTIGLKRRLLANYLLFGLLSIAAVIAGVWFLFTFSGDATRGQEFLARLTAAAEEVTADFASADGQHIQQLVQTLVEQDGVLFCAVVAVDGTYAAHSNDALIGTESPRRNAVRSGPGVIERTSILRPDNSGFHEYRLPLKQSDVDYGVLSVGVTGYEGLDWTDVLRRHAASAMVLPMLFLLLGGGKLMGIVRSSATLERQLSSMASNPPERQQPLRPVEASSPAAIGWNRLVEQSGQGQILTNLERRLNDVLGGFREDKSARILQSLTDGIAVTNDVGKVTFANRAFSVLLKNDSRATDWLLEELVLSRLPGNEDRFHRQMSEPSRPGVVELHRSADVSDGVLRLARFPLRSEDGTSLNHVWSLRDVTQQKLAEQTRDQFVDSATRELRAPLDNIKACANSLRLDESIEDERIRQSLETIDLEATRLGQFVDHFLNISRMEAGSLTLNRCETDVEQMISDVIVGIRPQLEAKKLELEVFIPPGVPGIDLDQAWITAALTTILTNAGRYTPEGGRVSLQIEPGKDVLRVHVEDSGFGISPNDLPRVFNKFFRSDDERVRSVAGTGLGLSFAHEVVRLHGGKITVKSEPGKGSRFTVILPLSQEGRDV